MDEMTHEEERLIEMLKELDPEDSDSKERENLILTVVIAAYEDDVIEEVTEFVENNKEFPLNDVFRRLFDEGILEKVEIEE